MVAGGLFLAFNEIIIRQFFLLPVFTNKGETDRIATFFNSFIVVGILHAAVSLLANRSLWVDEASLALNIVSKPALDLFQPLAYNQVAPIGFLLSEKLFAFVGGNTDWSLRIFPFLMYLLAIPLLFKLAERVLNNSNLARFATGFFAVSYYSIAYSGEVKQYMADLTAGLAIMHFTLNYLEKRTAANTVLLVGVGMIGTWFSNTAVILLFTCGIFLIRQFVFVKTDRQKNVLVLCSWLVSFATYYYFFINGHPAKARMVNYWTAFGAFFPSDIYSKAFLSAVGQKLIAYFGLSGIEAFSLVAVPVYCAGIYSIGKRDSSLLFLLIFPVIVHLLLSCFKLYPFEKRLILYLYPALIILCTAGLFELSSLIRSGTKAWLNYLLIASLLLNLNILYLKGFPLQKEEIKKSLTRLNREIDEADQVYLYAATVRAFTFYEANYPALSHHPESSFIIGGNNRQNWAGHAADLDQMTKPSWLLFSHVIKVNDTHEAANEEDYIISILLAKGFCVDASYEFRGSSLYHLLPPGGFTDGNPNVPIAEGEN